MNWYIKIAFKGIPSLSFRDVIKFLNSFGYFFSRQGKGSHQIFQGPNGKVSVPQSRKDIDKGTFLGLLRRIGISSSDAQEYFAGA